MDAGSLIKSLEAFPARLTALVNGVPPQDGRWRPGERQWSILEIVNHLADEEVDDFRRRVQLTLEDPARDWPPIDPEAWALERRHNERDLGESLSRFRDERDASLRNLRALNHPDWSSKHVHPKLGSMRAGDLLAAWTSHDLLHARQIVKRLYQLVQRDCEGYVSDYAGAWVA